MQAYLAKKNVWLVDHPTVQPIQYCKARKLQTLQPKVLKEQVYYMPWEQQSTTIGEIIAKPAK